jgi:hypothetical protein
MNFITNNKMVVFENVSKKDIVLNIWNTSKENVEITINYETYELSGYGEDTKEPHHVRELNVEKLELSANIGNVLRFEICN